MKSRWPSLSLALLVTPLAASGARAQTLLHDLPSFVPREGRFDYDQDGFADFIASNRVLSGFDASVLVDLSSYWAVTPLGDLAFSGDGTPDFLVSELGITFQSPSTIHAVSGSDLSELASLPFGFTFQDANVVREVGDVTGDGVVDAIVEACGFEGCIGPTGTIALFDGAAQSLTPIFFDTGPPDEPYFLVERAGDISGDGIGDVAITRGCDLKHDILFYRFANGNPQKFLTYPTTINANLSLAARFSEFGDYDGDGVDDFALQEPTAQDPFEVRIVSGANQSTLLVFPAAGDFIQSPGDANCDGVSDLLVSDGTATRLLSGADGSELWSIPESANNIIALGDVDADGARDFALRLFGSLQVWASPGPPVSTYCSGKLTSAGCVPTMTTTGTPGAQADDDFRVYAESSLTNKPGLFFWSTTGPTAIPFLGGTLCVLPPLRRGPIVLSTGRPTAWRTTTSCSARPTRSRRASQAAKRRSVSSGCAIRRSSTGRASRSRTPSRSCGARSAVAERVARPPGLEPGTAGLEIRCSIQLSYGRPWSRR